MEDNLKSIYDYLSSKGGQGSYEEFVDFFNANDDNKHTIYDYMAKEGGQGSYEEFLAFAGTPQRVDVSDVEKANQPNVVTLSEEELTPANVGNYTPRSGVSELKSPKELEASAQLNANKPLYSEWVKGVDADRLNDNYDLEKAYNLLPYEQMEAWRTGNTGEVHLPSVADNMKNGTVDFLKRKDHPSLQEELNWYNSDEPSAKRFREEGWTLDDSGDYYKYVRNTASEEEPISVGEDDGIARYQVPKKLSSKGYAQVTEDLAKLQKEFHDASVEWNKMASHASGWQKLGGSSEYNKKKDAIVSRMHALEEDIDKALQYQSDWLKSPQGQQYLDMYEAYCDKVDAVIKEAGGDEYTALGRFFENMAASSPTNIRPLSPQEIERAEKWATEGDILVKAKRDVKNARRQLRMTKERLDGTYKGFRRGWRATDIEGLSLLNDFTDKMTQLMLAKKVREGTELSPAEQALLAANELKAYTDMEFAGSNTMGERIGMSTAEQLVTTLQFYVGSELTGAMKIAKGITKGTLEGGTKLATKTLFGETSNLLRTAGAYSKGFAVGAAIQTFENPLSYLNMMADYAEKRTGTIYYDEKDQKIHYFDDEKSVALSLWQSAAGAYLDNSTEFAGFGLDKLGKLGLGKLYKAVPELEKAVGSVTNFLDKIKLSKISGFKIDAMDDFLQNAGFAGSLGEWGEEVLGNIVRPFMYIDTEGGESYTDQLGRGLKNLIDKDQNIETFLSCAVTGVFMGTVSTLRGAAAKGMSNKDTRQFVRDNMAKLDAMMGGVTNLNKEEFKEYVADHSITDISQYIKDQAQANNWSSDEIGIVSMYVIGVAEQQAIAEQGSEQIKQAVKEAEEQARQLVNKWDGDHIYNVTVKDPNTGELMNGTIVNGRVHYSTSEDGSYKFNPYYSSGMLAIRLADGSVKQMSGLSVQSLDNVMTLEEQLALQGQNIRGLMQQQFEQDGALPTMQSTWGFEFEPGATEVDGYTFVGKDKNGDYVFSKDDKDVTLTEEDVIAWGLRRGIALTKNENANNEMLDNISGQLQQMDADADLMSLIGELKRYARSVPTTGMWDAVKRMTSEFVTLDENGLYDTNETTPNDAAVNLYAKNEGNYQEAKQAVAAAIASLNAQAQQGVAQAVQSPTGSAVGNTEIKNAVVADTKKIADQIAFLNEVDKVLDKMQTNVNELRNADMAEAKEELKDTMVSDMKPGTQFPIVYDNQKAVGIVSEKDGKKIVSILGEDGSVIVEDASDIDDEQWEALRRMAVEMENAPKEVVEEAPKEEKPAEKPIEQPSEKESSGLNDALKSTAYGLHMYIDNGAFEDSQWERVKGKTRGEILDDAINQIESLEKIIKHLVDKGLSSDEILDKIKNRDAFHYLHLSFDPIYRPYTGNIVREYIDAIRRGEDISFARQIKNSKYQIRGVETKTPAQPEAKAESVVETKEELKEKTIGQRLEEFSAKHGDNTQNKLENTVKSIKKDIDDLTKKIAEAEKKLDEMPEPYDTKTQKAQEQQEKKIEKLQKEFQEKQDALTPFAEMLEEFDRQKAEKQGRMNKADEALQSLDENMKLYSEAPQEDAVDKEPANKHEFASTFLGSFQKSKNRLNKESLKTETGWSDADVKKLNGILSAEGGMSVDEMAEAIFADAQEQYPGFFTDFNDAKTTLLEVLQEADNAGSIDTYIKDRRRGGSEVQARMDYEARQLGYEDAADMREKRMADAQQKLESLKDKNGFITEEGLKEFQDYVEGLKIKEAPAQAETADLNEQVEEAGFVNPNETEVPFQKVGEENVPLTEDEIELRDALVETLRDAGIDVSTDTEEGQEILDKAKRQEYKMSVVPKENLEKDLFESEKSINFAAKNTEENGNVSDRSSQNQLGESDSSLESSREDRRAARSGENRKDARRVEEIVGEGLDEIRQWAKENGRWIPFTNQTKLGTPYKSGDENNNYLNEDGYLYKVNNLMHSKGSIKVLFDRVDIHNEIFPETQYEFVGFTGFDSGGIYPVFRQKYVKNAVFATKQEIEDYMRESGFKPTDKDGDFSNGAILIRDLQPRNVLKGQGGEIYVVDPDIIMLSNQQGISSDIKFHRANSNNDIFVSNAAKAVEGIKQEKATPEQWLKMIEKNGGLKAGEDKWLGLSDWLKEQDAKTLTKQQVLDFINENKIQIEEVEYVDKEYRTNAFTYKEAKDDFLEKVAAFLEDNEIEDLKDVVGKDIAENIYPSFNQFGDEDWGRLTIDDRFIRDYLYEHYNIEEQDPNQLIIDFDPGKMPIKKLHLDYVTEGLYNLKNIVLTVPTIEEYHGGSSLHFPEQTREVGWARFGETADENGNRVLVIDEIQSDRFEDMRKGKEVPAAPFNKNWQELVMKRMLRLAAEEGYDQLAWTTGEQQADRYDMSNTIESIECNGVGENKSKLFNLNGPDYVIVVNADGVVVEATSEFVGIADPIELIGKSLADVVGSPLAEKMLSMKKDDTIDGDGIKVGGEGMKGFYDQMLPAFMNKYGKKWGVKVGEVTMPNLKEGYQTMHSIDITPEMKEDVMEGQVMFFRTSDGKAYGFTKDGKIYVDPSIATSETPIHEYMHLWAEALRSANIEAWKHLTEELKKDKDTWNYVKNLYPELEGDDLIEEVFAHFSGKRGSERLREEQKRMTDEAKGKRGIAKVAKIFDNIRKALSKFWNMARKLFAGNNEDLEKLSIEDLADMATNDMLNGFNPRKVKAKEAKAKDKEYITAIESGDMTKAQEMVDEAAERAGYTIRGYHGTTHLFTIFDKSKGNAEGNWGKGFYFTNNEDDANSNYATSEGPDLNSRIEQMAEQMEWMDGYEDMDYEQRKEEARKILDGGQQRIISAALHMENPLVIGGNSDMQETYFDYNEEYDEENDEYGEPSGLLVDFADAWNDVINSFEWDAFSNLSASEILEYGFDGGLTASQLEDKAREVLDSHGIQNYDGNMATGDFLRQVFERMGFDGIVDSRVNIKFGTQRRYGKSMEGMDYGTLHFIVNEPNQIKQTDPVTYDDNGKVIPLSERFNEKSNDIRFQKADEGVTQPESSSEEELNKYNAGTLSTKEVVAKTLAEAAAKNKDDANKRLVAINAISKNLHDLALKLRQMSRGTDKLSKRAEQNIRGAVSGIEKATADYDKATIDQIVRLSKILMDSKLFKDFSNYEVRRLLAVTRDATGSKDITKQAEKVVDIMLDHALKEAESIFENQMKIQGSKVGTNGVEVQGKLDVAGQRMMKALKEAMKLDADALADRLSDAQDKMGSDDKETAEKASSEYQGLKLAQQYQEVVVKSEADEAEIRSQFEKIKEEKQLSGKALRELKAATDESIRNIRADRLDAYLNLTKQIGGDLQDYIGRAKAFREKKLERVKEIQHHVSSDMKGIPDTEHHKIKKGSLTKTFLMGAFDPQQTFENFLKFVGSKSVDGHGYTYDDFMWKYHQAKDKGDRAFLKDREALNKKVSEVFDKKMEWGELYLMEQHMPKVTVKWLDGKEMRDHIITQGNATYIYMVNKMTDGRAALRAMGITEEDVNAIVEQIDPKFIAIADWAQGELLPGRYPDYNATYKEVNGADMDNIENYFPLKRNLDSMSKEENLGEDYLADNKIASTITGSVIKRTKNILALDLLNADAFEMIYNHLDEMEQWAAMAPFNEDLVTLVSYKHFRNQLKNISSMRFGEAGVKDDDVWTNFKRACAIVSGAYIPKRSSMRGGKAVVDYQKNVATAKISLRINTAIKQLASHPAFWVDASPVELAKYTNPVGAVISWNWAMENLPGFVKRWKSRTMGDTRLRDMEHAKDQWNHILNEIARMGLSPNAFVDALTVAMGSKAVYETKLKRYLKDGYSEEKAKQKALFNATTAYNSAQQSAETAYVSPMQLDKDFWSTSFSLFRNGPFGYGRRYFTAAHSLKIMMKKGAKQEMLDFEIKKAIRDGLNEESAKRAAERAWRRSWGKHLLTMALFGHVLPMMWSMFFHLPYYIWGNDDDKKKSLLKEDLWHGLLGPIEAVPGGSVATHLVVNGFIMGRGTKFSTYDVISSPLFNDAQTVYDDFTNGRIGRGFFDTFGLLFQAYTGWDIKSVTDAGVAIYDYANGEPEISKEGLILALRIAQAPQSQIDELYIDELGMSGKDAKKLSVEDVVKRYVDYHVHRDNPAADLMYGDEEMKKAENRYVKKFEKMIQDRIANMEDESLERVMESDDAETKNLIGKEIANRMGGQDKAGSKPSSNWNEDTKIAHETYQKLRSYRDVVEDVLLQNAQKEADEAYEQALKDGDMAKAKEYQKRANRIEDVRRNILEKKHSLGKKGGEKDAERMEKIRAYRKKKMQDLGIK